MGLVYNGNNSGLISRSKLIQILTIYVERTHIKNKYSFLALLQPYFSPWVRAPGDIPQLCGRQDCRLHQVPPQN